MHLPIETLKPLLALAAQAAVPVIGLLISRSLHTTAQHKRAEHLSIIANAAAAIVLAKNPSDSWRNLLASTIAELSNAAGLPTQNADAIKREAAAALTRAGVKPTG